MSQAKAQEFIEKFFSDDAFVEEAIRKNGGVPKKEVDDGKGDLDEKALAKIGAKVGYDFTAEEAGDALSEYFRNKGFGGFRKLIHTGRFVMKLQKKIEKENRKK